MLNSNSTVLPPHEVITATDKGGLVTVVNALFLCFVLCGLCIRLWIRLRVNGPWRLDDNAVAAATTLSIVHSALTFVQVKEGLGKTGSKLDIADVEEIGRFLFASNIFYIAGLLLSKCAVNFLYLRLTVDRWERCVSYITLALSFAWAIVSVLLITIQCSPAHPWNQLSQQCSGLFTRWQAIAALDVITEVALFSIAVYLVVDLQMPKRTKFVVLSAFGFRLLTIAAAAARLHYLRIEIRSRDPTLDAAFSTVWTIIELDFGILATTLSCVGPFVSPFEQSNGIAAYGNHIIISRSRTQFTQRSTEFKLSQVSSASRRSHSISRDRSIRHKPSGTSMFSIPDIPTLRNDVLPRENNITHESRSTRASIESHESQRGIMRKVEWRVEHGTRSDGDTLY